MKILFFGDVVGKIGRQGLKAILPELKKIYQPDLVIANGENLAHGAGITKKIYQEVIAAGVDLLTSGNHVLSKPEAAEVLSAPDTKLLRPANYPLNFPGLGFKIIEVGSKRLLVINLLGQVFMKEDTENPFKKIDEILNEVKLEKLNGIIVDFHAEATSEKVAFGWYVDGRVSAVVGTHTHVPTADAKILPGGTAYLTDVGLVGASVSVIGDKIEPIINSFLTGAAPKIEIPEEGEVTVNAVFLEIDNKNGKVKTFLPLDKKIKI